MMKQTLILIFCVCTFSVTCLYAQQPGTLPLESIQKDNASSDTAVEDEVIDEIVKQKKSLRKIRSNISASSPDMVLKTFSLNFLTIRSSPIPAR